MSRCGRCGYGNCDSLFKPTCWGNSCYRGICDRCAEKFCCQKCSDSFICGGDCMNEYVDSVFCSFDRKKGSWICLECCDQLRSCNDCCERYHSDSEGKQCYQCQKNYCHQCLSENFCDCQKYCQDCCPNLKYCDLCDDSYHEKCNQCNQ